jgi:hypothetical protein
MFGSVSTAWEKLSDFEVGQGGLSGFLLQLGDFFPACQVQTSVDRCRGKWSSRTSLAGTFLFFLGSFDQPRKIEEAS